MRCRGSAGVLQRFSRGAEVQSGSKGDAEVLIVCRGAETEMQVQVVQVVQVQTKCRPGAEFLSCRCADVQMF